MARNNEFGSDGLEVVSTAFFARALCAPAGPVADPGRVHFCAAHASGGGCHGDRQVSGRGARGLPTRAKGKEEAVAKATWVGGG